MNHLLGNLHVALAHLVFDRLVSSSDQQGLDHLEMPTHAGPHEGRVPIL